MVFQIDFGSPHIYFKECEMGYNFSLKLISNLACLVLLISVLGCGLLNDEIDDFLDEYEEVVETWEAKSGDLSSSDSAKFERDMARLTDQFDEIEADPSADQEDRIDKLDVRMVKIGAEIAEAAALEALEALEELW